MNIEWLTEAAAGIDTQWLQKAQDKQNHLTKPPGSLGRLEDIAIRLSALQATGEPQVNNIQIVVFAADHGVAVEGVSAFPQAVTLEMIKNFARGGAAISVLAKQLSAGLEVVNLGSVLDHEDIPGVIKQRIAAGTANFSQQPAMTQQQFAEAAQAGRDAVDRLQQKDIQLFIGGDMGIANTTASTAIACALLQQPAEVLVGPGTGLDPQGVNHKAEIINRSLQLHRSQMNDVIQVLQCVGGFEIVALTAAYIACAQAAIPVVVDGFIASVAALAAVKLNASVRDWLFFSHSSAEPGHKLIMQHLNEQPLLDLGMRLGEGSGAAVAVSLIKHACALHNGMATFEQAGVSNRDD